MSYHAVNLQHTVRALEKYRTGEDITDAELDNAIPVLRDFTFVLSALGDLYRLTWADLNMKLGAFEAFQEARDIDKRERRLAGVKVK